MNVTLDEWIHSSELKLLKYNHSSQEWIFGFKWDSQYTPTVTCGFNGENPTMSVLFLPYTSEKSFYYSKYDQTSDLVYYSDPVSRVFMRSNGRTLLPVTPIGDF